MFKSYTKTIFPFILLGIEKEVSELEYNNNNTLAEMFATLQTN